MPWIEDHPMNGLFRTIWIPNQLVIQIPKLSRSCVKCSLFFQEKFSFLYRATKLKNFWHFLAPIWNTFPVLELPAGSTRWRTLSTRPERTGFTMPSMGAFTCKFNSCLNVLSVTNWMTRPFKTPTNHNCPFCGIGIQCGSKYRTNLYLDGRK